MEHDTRKYGCAKPPGQPYECNTTQTTSSCACDCHPENTTKGKRYICEHCDKTIPSEEWVSEYYDLCRELKYHDLVPRVRMKEFIEKIRAAAYQQGRLDEGEVCGYDQGYEKGYEEGVRHGEGTGNGVQRYQMGYKEGHKDGIAEEAVGCDEHCKASYEKGVRDSLEALPKDQESVGEEFENGDDGPYILGDGMMRGHNLAMYRARTAISTLLT